MRAPYRSLAEYCESGLDPESLAERLTMTGTEVERLTTHGVEGTAGFVVGHVLAAEGHPNADRLKVCSIEVGEERPRTIVCGAPNIAAGQVVAVALPGAVMPDGTELGEAKLRGVASSGMVLSEVEMEVGTDAGGIAVLGAVEGSELRPGMALADVLAISDSVLELEVTPNRPDCLGLYGVAREVHAITGAPLAEPPWSLDAEPEAQEAPEAQQEGEGAEAGAGQAGEHASVRVEVPELCPRFTARVFTDVEIGPSPLWLKQRLLAAGQRPINNVVDITNYVMLLTGQPLHAFDLDRVPGGELIVRRAHEGETMRTLDDVERRLDPDAVLVCDRDGPSGIAGIMGGQVSEVSATTTSVLMEVATWNGPNILATSGRLGLRSEASTRFEKQLHPAITMRAQRIAARLMTSLCGARMVPGTIDVDAADPSYEPFELTLRTERMRELLGIDVGLEAAAAYLGRLGYGIESTTAEALTVTVPPDRHFDTTREVDLIEEVARVHGIDEHLPATLPPRTAGRGTLSTDQRLLRRAEDVLVGAGLAEAITWSFVDPHQGARLGEAAETPSIRVHNPLSEEQSTMRRELLGGLLGAASHNLARGVARVALFESGRVYLPEPPPPVGGVLDGAFAGSRPAPAREPHRLGAVLVGPLTPSSWRQASDTADFYAAKGLVELLAASMRVELGFEADRAQLPTARQGRRRDDRRYPDRLGRGAPSDNCCSVGTARCRGLRARGRSIDRRRAGRIGALRGRHHLPRRLRGPGGRRR